MAAARAGAVVDLRTRRAVPKAPPAPAGPPPLTVPLPAAARAAHDRLLSAAGGLRATFAAGFTTPLKRDQAVETLRRIEAEARAARKALAARPTP